jgi:uncharacterized membrane protein YbhN (UPF0104 family)
MSSDTKSSAVALRRRFSWFGLLRLVGIVVCVVLLWRIDHRALGAHLKSVDLTWFLGGLLLQCAVLTAKVLRWHILTVGTSAATPFIWTAGQYLESYAMGVVTPGRFGEFMRVGHGVRAGGAAFELGFLVLCERAADAGFFVLGFGGAALLGCLPWFGAGAAILLLALGAAMVAGTTVLLCHARFRELLQRLIVRTPLRRFGAWGGAGAYGFWPAFWVALLGAISACCAFLSVHFLTWSVGLPSTFMTTVGAVAGAGLLTSLPVTVMGMGTREMTLLFVFANQPQELVLAFSALILIVAQIGGGTLALIAGQAALWFAARQKRPVQAAPAVFSYANARNNSDRSRLQ